MKSVEERAWRYVRRSMFLYEDERPYYEWTIGFAFARLAVAARDARRSMFGATLQRLVRWLMP